MRQSMTGFAHQTGEGAGHSWVWEMRGVNGKGLDLRLRLPDGIEGLEAYVRQAAGKVLARGNIQINLRLGRESGAQKLRVDDAQLAAVLDAMSAIESDAMARGLSLAPSTAADIVGLRGILTDEPEQTDPADLADALKSSFDAALAAFVAMRQTEGAAMAEILTRHLSEIETLVTQAGEAAQARAPAQAERMKAQMARVLDEADIDPQRLAQELAVIAVKSDITEEIDRLRAHVTAARDLLQDPGAVGRKLDFLSQEFNREANTLCSKSGDAALTQIGLALKTTIDQMREQVQNVE